MQLGSPIRNRSSPGEIFFKFKLLVFYKALFILFYKIGVDCNIYNK